MAGFQLQMNRQRLQAEATGTVTQVPSDPVGRLAYYLKCVESVGEADFPAYMTNYAGFRSWSQQQRQSIIQAARRHHPNRVLRFIEVGEVPGGSNNEFLRLYNLQESITAMQLQGAAGGLMALRRQLGGREAKGTIMLHNDKWERDNYHLPMQRATAGGGGGGSGLQGAEALVGMLALMALAANNDSSDSD